MCLTQLFNDVLLSADSVLWRSHWRMGCFVAAPISMDIILIFSVGVAWIWPSSWPMRIWWPRPRSSQGMTIRHDKWTRIGLEIEVSLKPGSRVPVFTSMRIRIRGSSFYLIADPAPWIQFLPQCESGDSAFCLNVDPAPRIQFLPQCGSGSRLWYHNDIEFAFVHLNRRSRI
jgi:hypothetical protein